MINLRESLFGNINLIAHLITGIEPVFDVISPQSKRHLKVERVTMEKDHLSRRAKKAEISIFQTTQPRMVCTRIQLFFIMMSLVSSFFMVIVMAEGNEIELGGFRLKCSSPRSKV